MATAKQLAALAKARAARQKNLRAKRGGKTVGTSQTKKSLATGKKPSARLKKRRSKNTKPGYYPNPSAYAIQITTKKGELAFLKQWTTKGPTVCDRVSQAMTSDKNAMSSLLAALNSKYGNAYKKAQLIIVGVPSLKK